MKSISPILLGLSLAVVGSSLAAAQETTTFPKVLQITREFTKPYKGGAAHDKTESAFVEASRRAKVPANYIALNSMSGKARALFLTQYASFAEWQKVNDFVDKNKALSAEFERAGIADGELLDSVDSSVFTRDEELSYKPHADISSARYMEISVFHVRLGHGADWRKLGKMVRAAHDKAGTSAHWAMFEAAYGVDDGTYIAISGDKSMADIDTGYAEDKKFRDAIGEDGMKELNKLYGETVDSSHSELFAVNPRQSYVAEEWIKANPDFWKPKPAGAPAAAPAAKPAEAKKPNP
ncbi:MAG TPA: hypothetical protein VN776_00575 [Terracidiphilus sp.]|nr:hypothetical protein [Terracidiphilus sp.]